MKDYQLISPSGEVEDVVKIECSVQAGIVFTTTTYTNRVSIVLIYTNSQIAGDQLYVTKQLCACGIHSAWRKADNRVF